MSPSDPTTLSAGTLSSALAAGELSAAALMEATLARINAVNPALNAIVSLRPRAELMAEAEAADAAPRRGWLHGIPMAVKDLADTAGLRTTYGSPLFADHVPEADDPFVARLRAAGAIIVGKTNVPEWGLGSHSFNPVHGATVNAFDPARSAGGSSGGAAVALAARMLSVADGSDMMGSLRNPAAWNDVYGLRPSWGLVPGKPDGDLFLHQLATDGPMARNPRDLAGLLDVMAGPHPSHPLSRAAQGRFSDALEAPISGARIGWIGDWGGSYPLEDGVAALCESALDGFGSAGCHVEPVVPEFDTAALWQSWLTLRAFAVSNKLAAIHADPERRALLKPEAIWEAEQGLGLSARDVHLASVVRSDWYRALMALFSRYDALALPSAQCFAFPVEWRWPETLAGRAMDTYHRWMEVVVPASLVGVPAISVPAGFDTRGLAMGVQLIGPPGGDAGVLRLAEAGVRRDRGGIWGG